MFYFDKYDPRVLFQDIRNFHTKLCDGRDFTVEPDIIADFTNMPHPDNSFSMVIFDPPHLRYTGSKKEAENWQMVKYGSLPSHGWQDIIRKGFSECFRVLMPGGGPHLQMERDGHQSFADSRPYAAQARIRSHIRQAG